MADDLEIRLTAHDEVTPALERNAEAVEDVKTKTQELTQAEKARNEQFAKEMAAHDRQTEKTLQAMVDQINGTDKLREANERAGQAIHNKVEKILDQYEKASDAEDALAEMLGETAELEAARAQRFEEFANVEKGAREEGAAGLKANMDALVKFHMEAVEYGNYIKKQLDDEKNAREELIETLRSQGDQLQLAEDKANGVAQKAVKSANDAGKAASNLGGKLDSLGKQAGNLAGRMLGVDATTTRLVGTFTNSAASIVAWGAVIKGLTTVIGTYIEATEKAAKVDFANSLETIADKAKVAEEHVSRLLKALDMAVQARDAFNAEKNRHDDAWRGIRRSAEDARWQADIRRERDPARKAELERRYGEWKFTQDRDEIDRKNAQKRQDIDNRRSDTQKRLAINAEASEAAKAQIRRAAEARDLITEAINNNEPGLLKQGWYSVKALFGGFNLDDLTDKDLARMQKEAQKQVEKAQKRQEELTRERQSLENTAKLIEEQSSNADSEYRAMMDELEAKRDLELAQSEPEPEPKPDGEDNGGNGSGKEEEEEAKKKAKQEEEAAKEARQAAIEKRAADARLDKANKERAVWEQERRNRSAKEAQKEAREEIKRRKQAAQEEAKRRQAAAEYDRMIKQIENKATMGQRIGLTQAAGFQLTEAEKIIWERELEARRKAAETDKEKADAEKAKDAADARFRESIKALGDQTNILRVIAKNTAEGNFG